MATKRLAENHIPCVYVIHEPTVCWWGKKSFDYNFDGFCLLAVYFVINCFRLQIFDSQVHCDIEIYAHDHSNFVWFAQAAMSMALFIRNGNTNQNEGFREKKCTWIKRWLRLASHYRRHFKFSLTNWLRAKGMRLETVILSERIVHTAHVVRNHCK